MAGIIFTTSIDTSVLERIIPEIVAFGRRTMIEQCVTSGGIIAVNAQKGMVAVAIGIIESELDIVVTPAVLKSGKISKNKRRQREIVSVKKGVPVPLSVLIVMARTDPTSPYSLRTGNRWPLNAGQLPIGVGSGSARRQVIAMWVSRMSKARFSSTHFLQHGWSGPIRRLLSDPNFKGWATKYQTGVMSRAATASINALNRLDPSELGMATVDISGDACLVMAENAIGQEGNEVLDAKHREALILHGMIPLQEAIDRETIELSKKLEEYFNRGLIQNWGVTA